MAVMTNPTIKKTWLGRSRDAAPIPIFQSVLLDDCPNGRNHRRVELQGSFHPLGASRPPMEYSFSKTL